MVNGLSVSFLRSMPNLKVWSLVPLSTGYWLSILSPPVSIFLAETRKAILTLSVFSPLLSLAVTPNS